MSLTPLPPCGLTWTIERPPPSPYLSTWFMNAALQKIWYECDVHEIHMGTLASNISALWDLTHPNPNPNPDLTKSMLLMFQVFSNNQSFVQQTRYFLLKITVVHLFQTYIPTNRESFYIHYSLLGPTVWIGHRRRVVQGIIESTGCCCLHQT